MFVYMYTSGGGLLQIDPGLEFHFGFVTNVRMVRCPYMPGKPLCG